MIRRGAAIVVLTLTALVAPAGAQDTPAPDPTGVQVPTQDIVPEPNSGRAPTEAGDRGGALQLLILVLVVAAVGGAVWHLVRQARRAQPG